MITSKYDRHKLGHYRPVKNCKIPRLTHGEICLECNWCNRFTVTRILILDPGSITGYAIYNRRTKELLDSGCIRLSKAPANKLTYLEIELSNIIDKYQPDKIYKEKKYEFVRGRKNVHAVMVHATYHDTIVKIASECEIPLVEIDTRRWAKKKIAQARAREITGRKKISDHESECICWGRLICMTKGL